MPFTPNYGLPCPNGDDPPCEGAEQIQDLAESFQSAAAFVLSITDRATNILGAMVAYQGADIPIGVVSLYNTVIVDVGGFADLSAFPDRLTFPRSGRYMCGGGAAVKPHAAADGYLSATYVAGGPFVGSARCADRPIQLFTTRDVRIAGMSRVTAGQSQSIRIDTYEAAPTAGSTLATSLWMWAVWVAD